MEGSRPRIIPNRSGAPLTPSLVGFTPSGDRVVGEAARLLAEEYPQNVAAATKRFIGRRFSVELAQEAQKVVTYPLVEGGSGEVRVEIAGRVLPVTQIGAMILGELKLDAQAYFGRPVTKAVITVPANFDDLQRQATREAAKIAGLDILRIVNEPTAAAVAYGLTSKFEGRALVFDLGGGTFDVSIMEVERGVFQVKATGGDPYLGGEDFDSRIVDWLLAQIPITSQRAVAQDKLSMQRLRVAAEKAKRELTTKEEAFISVTGIGDPSGPGGQLTDLETALTRTFFERLSDPLYRRCLKVCEKVMAEAHLDPKSVDQVLLVGGMTRVPLVRRLVAEYFGRAPDTSLNPDEAVALGAAVHAAELVSTGHSKALLLDVASHSLGVGTAGGGTRRLVQKNTSIPVMAKEIFLPGQAGQREAHIPIFQGESDSAEGNIKLGELVLRGLKTQERAENPLEVTFELSSEGILSVRAVDVTTGLAEAIEVEARTELTAGEVKKLEREQSAYASERVVQDQAKSEERFKRLIERAEKLIVLLAKSAEENPGTEAEELVINLRALIEQGRIAQRVRNFPQMAQLGQKLQKLIVSR